MKGTFMMFRTSVLIALLVGLGGLFHVYPMTPTLIDVHIVAGIIVLVTVSWTAIQVKNAAVGVAAFLILLGGLLPLLPTKNGLNTNIFHLVIMIVAIGLAEMGISRARRTAQS